MWTSCNHKILIKSINKEEGDRRLEVRESCIITKCPFTENDGWPIRQVKNYHVLIKSPHEFNQKLFINDLQMQRNVKTAESQN